MTAKPPFASTTQVEELLRQLYASPLDEFARRILDHLCEEHAFLRGVFYVYFEEAEALQAVAGYGLRIDAMAKASFMAGEGPVGQSILTPRLLQYTDLPRGAVGIKAGASTISPNAMLLLPLRFNEQLYGLIQTEWIGRAIDQAALETYFEPVSRNIAAGLQGLLSNRRLHRLLEETRRQSEEISAREEEMRQNMEELEATQEEMRKQQSELEQLKDNFQQKAESRARELNKAVERFELAADTATEGLWDLELPDDLQLQDDTYFWWSDKFRQMLGYRNRDDFPDRLDSWASLLHPDHQAATLEAFRAHLFDYSGQTPYDVEYQLRRKTGEYRWYRAVGQTKRDADGKPLRVAGSLIDIQEKKDLEAAQEELRIQQKKQEKLRRLSEDNMKSAHQSLLQQKERAQQLQEEAQKRTAELQRAMERFQLAADTSTEGLWDLELPADLQLRPDTYFWWSNNFRHLLGYADRDELPNRFDALTDKLHPDHQAATLEAFRTHLFDYSGQTPFDVECLLLRRGGTYRWFRLVAQTKRDADGKPLRSAGSLIDIQEKKELQDANDRLRFLGDNLSGMFYRYLLELDTGRHGFDYASGAIKRLFQLEPEAVAGRLGTENPIEVHPDDRADFEQAFAHSAQHLSRFTWSGRLSDGQGDWRWIKLIATPQMRGETCIQWDGYIDETEVQLF